MVSDIRTGDVVVHRLELGVIGTNCYIVHRSGNEQCVIVDPGADPEAIEAKLDALSLEPCGVLITHCHWDHVGAAEAVTVKWGIESWMSGIEAPIVENLEQFAPQEFGPWTGHKVTHELEGTETLSIAGINFECMLLPGHSPGTIGFLVRAPEGAVAAPDLLFVGDLIFRGSVGRTDLPGGDHGTLLDSCRRVLTELPENTVLLSGHGPETTVGAEKRSNPFLKGL